MLSYGKASLRNLMVSDVLAASLLTDTKRLIEESIQADSNARLIYQYDENDE